MEGSNSPRVANAPAVLSCVGRTLARGARAALLAAALTAGGAVEADRLPTPDRFTATTTAMTPSGVSLRIDVREWSDEAARAAVAAALDGESGVRDALTGLPTIGYVWQGGTGVGYSVKYAHRVAASPGERVTFVTDRPLGAFDSKPWAAGSASALPQLEYSVIELSLDESGRGAGTLSLAAAVKLDPAQALVTLDADAAPRVLADAKREPKPYWAGK
jgi:hypothetical protein